MKKYFFFAFIVYSTLIFFSCKKSSSNNNGSGHWVFKGTTYKAMVVQFMSSTVTPTLTAESLPQPNTVHLYFASPFNATGNYIVQNGDSTIQGTTECTMVVNTAVNNVFQTFISTGKNGDLANLTISGTTLTASFTNVTVQCPSSGDTTTVTGTLSCSIQ